MSNHVLIKATALNRFYGYGKGKQHAVKDFNLELLKGEVLGLLGPNGAGKSTTMQMLTGNISPSTGEVLINSINLQDDPLTAKRSIGYLPEQPPIYRDMTTKEFLKFCAVLHDIPKAETKRAIDRALDKCGLQEVKNKLIANLSKGYQQRVGIAQAILHQPDVVILDEPTVGLDPIQITQIRQLIRDLGKEHSVILSTHILPEVQAVCDRVQIINQGKTVFSDSFDQLAKNQKTSQMVIGFDTKIDTELLGDITDVESVDALDNNRYTLNYKNSPNAAEISVFAQEHNWVLTELTPVTNTLEQIFTSLIHSDVLANTGANTSTDTSTNKDEAA